MDKAWCREAGTKTYVETGHLLRRLRAVELEITQHMPPDRHRRLQTRETLGLKELRDAALLCHGLAERRGEKIGVTHWENHDHDAVARIQKSGENQFFPLQLKQLPPDDINAKVTLQKIIDLLPSKYPKSPLLTVGISLNRDTRISFDKLNIPSMNIGGLFFFGAVKPDQSEWLLWGDALSHGAHATIFKYPD
ncbi:hypothetical protein [Lysobacter sp. Root983]|uniref:hypothetical protein n=1 Tax=Lysobacter sp. Root983 TaxID=1736613 RepID=UPI0012FB0D1A|nr:hypothetical protein [Lysobacter sp. Root983]